MNKKVVIVLLTLLLISLLAFLAEKYLGGKTPYLLNKGYSGISHSVSTSKKYNVFLAEYKLSKNTIEIGINTKATLGEAWLEKRWGRGKYVDSIDIFPNYSSLCINISNSNLEIVSERMSGNANFTVINSKGIELYYRGIGDQLYFVMDYENVVPEECEKFYCIVNPDSSNRKIFPKRWKQIDTIDSFEIYKVK